MADDRGDGGGSMKPKDVNGDEVLAELPQDNQIDVTSVDYDAAEQALLQESEVRLTKNVKWEEEIRLMFKQKTNCVESTINQIVAKFSAAIQEKEFIIEGKNHMFLQGKQNQEILESEMKELQTQEAQLQQQLAQQQQQSLQDLENKTKKLDEKLQQVVSLFEEEEIESVEKLKQDLLELKQRRGVGSIHEFILQKKAERANMRAQSDDSKAKLLLAERKIQQLEKEMVVMREHTAMNALSRCGEEKGSKKKMEKQSFQTQEDTARLQNCVGESKDTHMQSEFMGKTEIARNSNSDDLWQIQNEYESEEESEAGEMKEKTAHYHTKWDMGRESESSQLMRSQQQMHLEQQLPEPPKFSAEKDSISMESFERLFRMKYGRLNGSQQVCLLEAKFLTGRALRVYKGLPEWGKGSLKTVLNSIADRLRVSKEDETRRAKTQFEKLTRTEGQSVEDFCLKIDEIAKRAFRRMDPAELSSAKCTKLVNSITDETVACLIDHRLFQTPEEEQYEMSRMMAIRHERAANERGKNRQKGGGAGEKKKAGDECENQNQVKPQQSQKSWPPKENEKRNHQQYFNSPSNNYQSNQSNKNFQFSSSGQYNQFTPPNQSNQFSQGMVPEENRSGLNDQGSHVSDSSIGVVGCQECHQTGCHSPNCSKAPNAPKRCFKCQEVGHFARFCPKQSQGEVQATMPSQSNVSSVSTLEVLGTIASSNGVNIAESSKYSGIKYEKGRIAGIFVDVLLDSGASISVLSKNMWDHIVQMKGRIWEKNIKQETPQVQKVVAANNQPIEFLFQVTLETAMGARTRKIPFIVADIARESVILGYNNFDEMGIQLVFSVSSENEFENHRVDQEISNQGQSRVEKSSDDGSAKGTAEDSATRVREEKHSGNVQKVYIETRGNNGFCFQQDVQEEEKNGREVIDDFRDRKKCGEEPKKKLDERSESSTEMNPFEVSNIQKSEKSDKVSRRVHEPSPSVTKEPGLKKQEDDACGVVFRKNTRRRRKPRPMSDQSMEMSIDCLQVHSARVREEWRPRKDPPHVFNRGRSSSCPRKSPMENSMSPDAKDGHSHQAFRPWKDPPEPVQVQYGRIPWMEQHFHVTSTPTRSQFAITVH